MIDVDLTINTDVAHRILTGFVRSEVTRVGYSRVVIGLSGGIDSALSICPGSGSPGPGKCPWRAHALQAPRPTRLNMLAC